MSTWHFEPWAYTDIREISKDLTHQLPNPGSHILKASILLLWEGYTNTLPGQRWAAQSQLLPVVPADIPKTELPPLCLPGPKLAAGHMVVPEWSAHWPSVLEQRPDPAFLCSLVSAPTLRPLGGKPLNPSSSHYSLLKREMQTGNQDTLKHGNCKFKHPLQPINQRLLISGGSLKPGVSSSVSDFPVAWNWAPSPPPDFQSSWSSPGR